MPKKKGYEKRKGDQSTAGYKVFHLQRVPYGKPDTSTELREYTVKEFPSSAVGSVNEIATFLKPNYKKIILRTNDMGDFKFNFFIED